MRLRVRALFRALVSAPKFFVFSRKARASAQCPYSAEEGKSETLLALNYA